MILVQQRCQRGAEKVGVTTALRLHDATNVYLDTSLFTSISWAVVTVIDEEVEIDILGR